MNEFVCNFAVARFRPYRETGEFVNVGVVLLCPQMDFFSAAFEHRKHKRITDFFPELDIEVFRAGLSGLRKELGRICNRGQDGETQLVLTGEAQARIAAFSELVRPREALFHFGEIGTTFASDPKAKLQELFGFYVQRQFARDREYQEVIMRRKLGEFLRRAKLDQFYRLDQRIGDDTYNVVLPFVNFEGTTARKAIKPLHLDKDTPTEIYRHGDAWISTVRRLRRIEKLPRELLFTIKPPTGNRKLQNAAEEVSQELERSETLTVPFADTDAILRFARV